MPVPRLFIVAGPNGAGKSLFSKELTESDFEVFDGDKHMTQLVKMFPETGSEALWSHINNNVFKKEKQEAIKASLNYAFETNFSAANPMESAYEFKNHGYEIHLVFMGLHTLEECVQRVAQRVRTGGHKVSEASIKYNYEYGLRNLYKYFAEFTSVTLFDNAIAYTEEPTIPKEILHIIEGVLFLESDNFPEWVKPVIADFDTSKIFPKQQ